MRLFVAIELDEQAAHQLVQLSGELRRRVEQRAPGARLTWVAPERMHLTVRFIGEVAEPQADRIRTTLATPLSTPPFAMTFEGTGAFPRQGPPRVLWAGITTGSVALASVEREVTARLLACGIAAEKRPYRPHLTLARVREPESLRTAGLFDGLDRVIGTSPVTAITLFRSRPAPTGAVYTRLESTNLRSSV